MRIILFSILFFLCNAVFAQQFSVKVNAAQQQPLAGATIELKKKSDSSLVKTALTSKEGIGLFENLGEGEFYFVIAHVGYETLQTPAVVLPTTKNTQTYTLRSKSETLQSVTVASKKPFIQQVQGKTVVNVDAMISNTGTTVLELLEKSPGILVDRN